MATAEISTKPYLLRALYEWCVDNGYTPHLAVKVDSRSQVPSEYGAQRRDHAQCLAQRGAQAADGQRTHRILGALCRRGAPDLGAGRLRIRALRARDRHGMTFDVDSAKPAIQTDAEKETGKPGPSNEAGPALPAPAATPTEPTKPTGGKPQLRRISSRPAVVPAKAGTQV
jgi:stringent starvation protein B